MAETARPQLVTPRANQVQREQPRVLELLERPKYQHRMAQIVPRHFNPERMLRVAALIVHKTPKLLEANPLTLLGSLMVCGSLGMEPNTPLGHVYLIPYDRRIKRGNQWVNETQVNLIIGYKGYIDLARRSGTLVSIHADVVYGPTALAATDGDTFSFEYGSDMHLKHIPSGQRQGTKLWAYAHANLKDGQAFEVLPYSLVLTTARDISEAYKYALSVKTTRPRTFETTPWVAHEHPMAAKTMIRRLSNNLSLSIEFANAARLDQMSEIGRQDMLASYAEEGNLREDDLEPDFGDGQTDDASEDAGEPSSQSAPPNTAANEPAKSDAPAGDAPRSTPARGAAPGESPQASGEASVPPAGAPPRRGRVNFDF